MVARFQEILELLENAEIIAFEGKMYFKLSKGIAQNY